MSNVDQKQIVTLCWQYEVEELVEEEEEEPTGYGGEADEQRRLSTK